MSYTYVAVDTRDGQTKAAFPRKHELARWARVVNRDEDDAYAVYHMEFFRIRSLPWERHSTVTEIPRGELIPL